MANFNALIACINNSVTSVGIASPGSTLTVSGSPVTGAGTMDIDLPTTGVTPGSYTNTNLTVDANGRISAASSGTGGSGTVWTLLASWDWSSNVPEVAFTGLAGKTDILVLIRNMALSVSGQRVIFISDDNGATYKTAGTDYATFDTNGIEGVSIGIGVDAAASTTAHGGAAIIYGFNVADVKVAYQINRASTRLILDTNALNALKVTPSAGGNITSGSIRVYGR